MDRKVINEYFAKVVEQVAHYLPLWHEKENAFDDWGIKFREEIGTLWDKFDFRVLYGATKIVIIDDGCEIGDSYVVKIPMRGCKTDYCADEVQIYEIAKEEGNFNDLFAECWLGGSVHFNDWDIPFYVMERADIDECHYSDLAWKSFQNERLENGDDEENIEEAFSWLEDDEYLWYTMATIYGDTAEAVIDYLDELGINDLHDGNIGFTADGSLKLIDYSGFNGF